MAVPYTFATATSAIPLSQLDSNFATTITLGNTAIQLGNTVTTLNNMTLANVTISSGGSFTSNSISTSGNLTFTGTGNRITGDMSNATLTNRLFFQNSVTNGISSILLMPNGTGNSSSFIGYNSSDPTNASLGTLQVIGSTDVRIQSTITGTGTYLPMTFYTGGSERMRVDTSGNVGIGTSAPSCKADVAGAIRTTSTGAPASGEGLELSYGGTANTADILAYDRTGSAFKNMELRCSNLIFNTGGGGERARIDSSGNLLVGNTSGSNLITAIKNQSGATAIIYAQNTNNTAGNFAFQAALGANCNTATSAHYGGLSGASAWYLLGNGTTTYSSDERLKKNIETARNGYLEDLCQLRVVKYNWANHEDSSPKELGLIAQEVEQVFPGLVQDDLRGEYEGITYKTLKGSVIPMLLLKAIQELKAELDVCKAEIAALKGAK